MRETGYWQTTRGIRFDSQATERQHVESDARNRLLTDNTSNQIRFTGDWQATRRIRCDYTYIKAGADECSRKHIGLSLKEQESQSVTANYVRFACGELTCSVKVNTESHKNQSGINMRTERAGHVPRMVERRDACRILVANWRVRVHLEELGLNGRQYYNGFQATGRRAWTGLIWHRVGMDARLL